MSPVRIYFQTQRTTSGQTPDFKKEKKKSLRLKTSSPTRSRKSFFIQMNIYLPNSPLMNIFNVEWKSTQDPTNKTQERKKINLSKYGPVGGQKTKTGTTNKNRKCQYELFCFSTKNLKLGILWTIHGRLYATRKSK